MKIAVRLPHRFWKQETLLLLLIVLSAPPTMRYVAYQEIATPKANAFSHMNLALGLHYTGTYPKFSRPVHDEFMYGETVDQNSYLSRDLRQTYPAAFWQVPSSLPFWLRGSDPGMTFIIHKLWQWTDSFTVKTVLQGFRTCHWLGGLSLYALASSFGVPGFALLSTLAFFYSPLVLTALSQLGYYAIVPSLTFIILACFVFAFRLAQKKRWRSAGFLTLLTGALMGAGVTVRTTLAYTVVPLTAIWIWSALRFREPKRMSMAYVLVLSMLLVRLFTQQMIWTPQRQTFNEMQGHSFWHPIWCGLGEFPNDYHFEWYDLAAWERVANQHPNVEYASTEYEQILRGDVLRTIAHHPLWWLSVLTKRLYNLSTDWIVFLPLGGYLPQVGLLLLLFIIMPGAWYFIRRNRADALVLLLILPLLFDIGVPLLVYGRNAFYNIATFAAVSFSFIYVVCRLSELVLQRLLTAPATKPRF